MKAFEDIENDFLSSLKESFGDSLAIDTSSNLYKLLYPFMTAVHSRYQQYQTFLDMRNVYKAEGLWLDYLLSNFNFLRKQASQSEVHVKVTGTTGKVFSIGDIIVKSAEDFQFYNTEVIEIPAHGVVVSTFKSIDKGADKNIAIGSITSLLRPVIGIDSVVNEFAGKGGQDRENDFEYRTRFLNNRIGAAYWNMGGLLKSITSLSGVNSAYVIENDKSFTVNGLPPHSIRIIVDGGVDLEIAKVILEKADIAIEKVGSTEISVVDINGENRVIRFDRPSTINVHYRFSIDNADSITINSIVKSYIDSASVHSTLSSLQCMRLIEKSIDLSNSNSLLIEFKREESQAWSQTISLSEAEKAIGVLYEL